MTFILLLLRARTGPVGDATLLNLAHIVMIEPAHEGGVFIQTAGRPGANNFYFRETFEQVCAMIADKEAA